MRTATKVRISELKAHLSEYLRQVQRGLSVTVLDRDTPIALLSPPTMARGKPPLSLRKGAGRLGFIRVQPPLSVRTDSLALLQDD
jgi:prevent-host-death family protein